MIGVDIDESVTPLFNRTKNSVELFYPCQNHYECFPYIITLSSGKYLFECYGASGGIPAEIGYSTSRRIEGTTQCIPDSIVKKYNGNTNCSALNSPGSGGYISGILNLKTETLFYAHVGGSGFMKTLSQGGYNGGGAGHGSGGSGGGATDIRVEADDIRHRIIVAGGGGGTDNYVFTGSSDDGAGGAGGYPSGQGYWINGVYSANLSTQTSGARFGYGADASGESDLAGGGGGWFGGYASNDVNGGAGGGSSFILTKFAEIPTNQNYAFKTDSEYAMQLHAYENGIWSGHGKIIITKIVPTVTKMECKESKINYCLLYILIIYKR